MNASITAGHVKVGLVQVNNSFSGQNYLPYSVACLQGYAQKNAENPGRYAFLPPVYKRMPINAIVDHLASADVVGFSTYVWNGQISLEAASRLKAKHPEVLMVFGGPQVPDAAEDFLRAHPFIDVVVHNEGEQTFLNLLARYPANDWTGMTGVSYIDVDGRFHATPPTPRFRDLVEVPSPFLNGIFDELMRDNPTENWIGLWETNRGCPFQCTFCDWGSATAAKVTKFGEDRLFAEIEWFADKKIEYIFVCDANFGIQKRDIDIVTRVAEVRAKRGYPHGFSVQNTKNATERAYITQKILSDAGMNKGVALSMQSLDQVTLKNIKRDNISLETYLELARRFTRDGVETYSDLILGLPGETYESFCRGVNSLIEAGQHNRIQFNNLSVLPNAEMGSAAYRKHFGMVTVRSEIINIHGAREELDDDVPEYQDLVVETASMPAADWCRARAFAWMAAFLHFDKLFQMPLIVSRESTGIPYRDMIEAFLMADASRYPVIGEICELFFSEAKSIQQGGPEYVFSREWLGIFWPADEYAFIKLTAEEKLDAFYTEAATLLEALVAMKDSVVAQGALRDAIRLNRALISQPFVETDIVVVTDYNVLEFCDGIRQGISKPLRLARTVVEINRSRSYYADMQTWCREVVWWGNKKGAYLYRNRAKTPDAQIAGHF